MQYIIYFFVLTSMSFYISCGYFFNIQITEYITFTDVLNKTLHVNKYVVSILLAGFICANEKIISKEFYRNNKKIIHKAFIFFLIFVIGGSFLIKNIDFSILLFYIFLGHLFNHKEIKNPIIKTIKKIFKNYKNKNKKINITSHILIFAIIVSTMFFAERKYINTIIVKTEKSIYEGKGLILEKYIFIKVMDETIIIPSDRVVLIKSKSKKGE